MEKITSIEEIKELVDNKIICDMENIQMNKSVISFLGKNNFLIVEKDANIINSKINFKGDNSIIFIKKSRNNKVNMTIDIYNDSFIFMDKGTSINGNIRAIISDQKNLIVGKDSMFSFGCWIRNSDAHLIYDIESNKRINFARDIIIGDHVWVGQDVSIMKTPFIGSGSVLGMGSLIRGWIKSNSVYAGNPCKLQREGIFWDRTPSQAFDKFKTEKSAVYEEDKQNYIFQGKDNSSFWKKKVEEISSMAASIEKIEAISKLSDMPRLIVKGKRFKLFL